MPAGSSKSAIYQIAALLLPGPTVIISPLIALQRDQVVATAQEMDAAEWAEVAAQAQHQRQQFQRSRLEMMQGYVETHDHRRHYLLSSFGEDLDAPCGYCGNCDRGTTTLLEQGTEG